MKFDFVRKMSVALLVACSLGVWGCTASKPNSQVLPYPEAWADGSIFKAQYPKAALKLKTMSKDEKIAQLFLVRTPEKEADQVLQKHQLGGYILYKRDVDGTNKKTLKEKIDRWNNLSKIKPLIAVDEEGGTVARISSDKNFRSARFPSPQQLYAQGGMKAIESNTKEMVQLFEELGVNVNLAPVADISTSPEDFIFKRSFGKDAKATGEFIETVVKSSKDSRVSFTLKHFPGYGNNKDTHMGAVKDNRSLEFIKNRDLIPFKAGVKAGAEAILVSHNVVTAIDPQRPASLSPAVVDFARKEGGFTGIVMTDGLDMKAITNYKKKGACVDAFLAGNDVLMVTDYEKGMKEIQEALSQGQIKEDELNRRVFRILAWKYHKGILKADGK